MIAKTRKAIHAGEDRNHRIEESRGCGGHASAQGQGPTAVASDVDDFDHDPRRPATIRAIPTKHNVCERPVSRDGNGEMKVATRVGAAEKEDWSDLMRWAVQGDNVAYHQLLRAITPVLRATARRALAQAGQPVDQSEDIVQETLIAIHLKRDTWDIKRKFEPWLFAVARNKLIDSMRRRRGRVFVNIDDFSEVIPTGTAHETFPAGEIDRHLDALPPRPREVLRSIAIDGESINATAKTLSMSEGAVRVALHRALSKLATKLRT